MSDFSDIDIFYMQQALELARSGLGRVAPNPSVGCVIVRDGAVVGFGRTEDGGRPHAEVVALDKAGDQARGADVYVTLEPCSHHGQTGPCADALIKAGVGRVFVACGDPNPQVNGNGLKLLLDAGVEVVEGLCRDEALEVNAGFFLTMQQQRPLVSLKMAVSADGKIAGAHGARVQITGAEAQEHMHRTLRATHDAIAVGRGTVLADNPLLTTRVAGLKHDIKRVVFGRDIPEGTHLAEAGGGIVIDDHDLKRALMSLAIDHSVTRLLVEGGAQVITAFLESGLWDQLYLYRSPKEIGVEGLDVPDFTGLYLLDTQEIGQDMLEIYQAKA